jgi:hypothetical protein
MNRQRCVAGCVLALVLTAGFLSGCGEGEDPAAAAFRSQFVLKAAPSDQTTFADVREQLLAEEAPAEVAVVVKGRITAGDLPPWEPGKAAFVLTDVTGHEGEEDHDPHQCPFCSRSIQDYIANVKFHDSQGSNIAIDSRELFGVTEKQVVTVKGMGHIDDANMLVINATGIYLADK